jgi:hypothetical protein
MPIFTGMGALIVLAIIAAVGYLVSLRLHPWHRCGSCKGTGRQFGAFFKGSHRLCTSCGGNGRRARLGVRTFHGGGQTWGERAPGQATAKRARNLGR